MVVLDALWMDASALAFAVVLDVTLGEPPAAVHPVVYMGKIIRFLEHLGPKNNRIAQFTYGLGMALILPAAFAAAGYFLALSLKELNPIVYIIVAGVILKACFAIRALGRSAAAVQSTLKQNDIDGARKSLAALVSRDTSSLTPSLASSAAVESVAENTTDSFVAPWLFFVVFGLPGALAYRVVNTLDSMIGYRGKYEYLGKASARLDDILNFIPARLSALAIAAASPLRGHSGRRALKAIAKEGHSTRSPNAGLTMAAMSGALGVTLEKVGCYRLGSGLRPPESSDISESINIMRWVAALACCLALLILVVHYAIL